jgi:hypothetical protein
MENQFSTLTNDRCESNSQTSSWYSRLWSRSPLQFPALMSRSKLTSAVQAVLSGLAASSRTLRVNNRLYVALVFMLVAAPLASVCYQLLALFSETFERTAPALHWYAGQHWFADNGNLVDGWYYKNWFYFFLTLAPFICQSMVSVGLFFLFPEDSKRAYFLVIPLSMSISKILWLITVDSNADYHRIVPSFFVVLAGLIAFLILFTFNWLMARKYHVFDALCARVAQIIQARKSKLIDEETADRLLGQEAEKLKAFNQQF